MSRARAQTVSFGFAAILVVAALVTAVPVAAAGTRPASAGGANQLLRTFPLGSRRLCCTTRSGSVAAASRTGSAGSRARGQDGAAVSGGTGIGGWMVELLAVIAALVAGLGVMAVLPTISRRTRSKTRQSTAGSARALADRPVRRGPPHRGEVRRIRARREAVHRQAGRQLPEPAEANGVAVRVATNGWMPAGEVNSGSPAVDPATSGNGGGAPADEPAAHPIEAAPLPYRATEQRRAEAVFNLGLLFYDAGELARAEVTWRRCLAHRDARAATNLGFLLEQRGDPHGARLAYSAAARWGDPEGRRLGAALTQCA
jgi:hypothetical protein